MKNNFFIKNFGCKINNIDSFNISKFLKNKNFVELNSFKNSNIVLINTCYVRNNSFLKFFNFVKKYKKLYIIFGCISNLLIIYLIKKIKYIDILIETNFYNILDKIIYNFEFYSCKQIYIKINFININKENQFNNLIKISDGCNKYCSYCVVPHTKGLEKQKLFFYILKDIFNKYFLKEICFLSQNVNSYLNFINHNYLKFINFILLIKFSIQILKIKFINFISSHLNDYNLNFLNLLKSDKILSFIHLPLQSFSNKLLLLMKRNYNFYKIKIFINNIINIKSNITINSDFILSFIFEKNLDFYKTIIFLEKFLFDKCFFFIYSKRPFTYSFNFLNKNLKNFSKKKLLKIKNKNFNNNIYINKNFLCKIYFILLKGFCFNFNNIFFGFIKNRLIKINYSKILKKNLFYKKFFKIKIINKNKKFFIGKLIL